MKIVKYIVYSLFAFVLLHMSSCDLESSDNGDLDGYWHLVKIDSLTTSGFLDLSEQRMFWSFQMKVLNVCDYDNDPNLLGYYLRFDKKDQILHIYNPYRNMRKDGDNKLEDITPLIPFGINFLEEFFKVEALNENEMVLTTDMVKLSFRKM